MSKLKDFLFIMIGTAALTAWLVYDANISWLGFHL